MDDERWLRILQRMPEVEEAGGPPLAVAFIGADDYAAKRGHGLALVAGQPRARDRAGRLRRPVSGGLGPAAGDERSAIEKVGADGTACMAHLARLLDIKPFVLRQRDELDESGVLEFIETLELATPKH
jgi:hypothetical protein